MPKDFAIELEQQLDSVPSVEAFCADWKDKWRCIAVLIQSVLQKFYPLGAKVLGFLIEVADKFCNDSAAAQRASRS